MWTLTYRRRIPPQDLLLRVMSDRDGARYWVFAVHAGDVTRASLRVLPPSETRVVTDVHGQEFYIPEQARTDIDGDVYTVTVGGA